MVGKKRKKLNKFDIETINLLRTNARESLTNIAHKQKRAVNTVFSRVANLQNYFSGFKSFIDFEELGYNIQILLITDYSENLLDKLKNFHLANNLQICGPEKKIFAICLFNSLFDFEEFKYTLESENYLVDYYTLNAVSEEKFRI